MVHDDLGQAGAGAGLVRLAVIDSGLSDLAAAGGHVTVRIELAIESGPDPVPSGGTTGSKVPSRDQGGLRTMEIERPIVGVRRTRMSGPKVATESRERTGTRSPVLMLLMATLGFAVNFWAWALISPLGRCSVSPDRSAR